MKTQVNEIMKIIQHTKVKFNKDIELLMKSKTKIKNSNKKKEVQSKGFKSKSHPSMKRHRKGPQANRLGTGSSDTLS